MKKFFRLTATVALAVMILSAAAAANSIDYDTGKFMSGTLTGSFSTAIDVSISGSLDTIALQTGTLIKTMSGCPTGSTCYNFSGGSVTVSNGSGTVFHDSISSGITIRAGGTGSIQAVLASQNGISIGSATATFAFSGMKITGGSEDVAFVTTPEPATLLLLGSGLVVLAARFGLKRRLAERS